MNKRQRKKMYTRAFSKAYDENEIVGNIYENKDILEDVNEA